MWKEEIGTELFTYWINVELVPECWSSKSHLVLALSYYVIRNREKKGNFAARSSKFHSWRFRKEEINNIREIICFLLDNVGKLFTRSNKETDQFKN